MLQKDFEGNERNDTGFAEPKLIWSAPDYEVYAVCTADARDAVNLTQRARRYLNERRPKGAPPFGVVAAVLGSGHVQ